MNARKLKRAQEKKIFGKKHPYEKQVMENLKQAKTLREKAIFCLNFAEKISDIRLEAFKKTLK